MHPSHSLLPLDVVVVCRLYSLGKREWTYATLADDLGVAASTAHESVDRCRGASLYLPSRAVAADKLRDLLLFAVPLVYPPSVEGVGQGTPTATAATFSNPIGFATRPDLPHVWPGAGRTRGLLLHPVHPSAARASQVDPLVYDLLALADVRRVGSVPDKELAAKCIETILRRKG